MQETKLRKKIVQAMLITISCAAIFHIILVSITSIIRRDVSYINPLDFLGLSIIFPQYRNMPSVALGGWLALIALYFILLYISIRFNLYVSIIREHPLVKRLSETSKKLQQTMREQSEIYEQTTRELLAKRSESKKKK